jgi:succinate dehydrogenase/fumarate reductase-like Fe-S protein
MKELIIYGEASKKVIKTFLISGNDLNSTTLLEFLMSHKIPVASSCLGEGVCKKCGVMINGEKVLTCALSIRDLFLNSTSETLSFSYL